MRSYLSREGDAQGQEEVKEEREVLWPKLSRDAKWRLWVWVVRGKEAGVGGWEEGLQEQDL